MKKALSIIRHSHPVVYKAVLFVIAIATIVYLLPKQSQFKYEFENLKGKPWHHENLIAPFDFAIKKTAGELADEKNEVLMHTAPYFELNTVISTEKKNIFSIDFETLWQKKSSNNRKSAKAKTLALGNNILDAIYKKGIIEPNESITGKSSDYTINVLNHNVAEEHELKDIYTVLTAHEFIKHELQINKNKADVKLLLPLLENSIAHSIFYDKATTQRVFDQAVNGISLSHNIILKDQSIISKGDIIDSEKYQLLESLKSEYEKKSGGTGNYYFIVLGQVIIVTICFVVLFIFLSFFRKEFFSDNANITFILLLMVLTVWMSKLPLNTQSFTIYLLPFCIVPIIIRTFFDTRLALFVHFITILIISFMASNRFEFLLIQLLAGIVTIFSIVNTRNRSQIFVSAALIFTTYSITFIGINIIHEGGYDLLEWSDFAWFGISAMLTLFSYPLIFVFEKIFGFISEVSLLELSDTNRKLLRELASRAPGTFQHSLQVANLAEEAIYTIGGNALLVRTGALYHDIGKMESPMYFIENQASGINPHDDLGFEESAAIIIDHVIKGVEIAKKHNLPEQIIDFIRTHHGTTTTAYFYRSFKNEFPDEKVNEDNFRYPGPVPFSKESAVLMMADSVEAASRSLKKYDSESIDNLVDQIISSQMEQNQFQNADITFKDINTIKKIFKKKLMNVYHVRVEYPR